MALAGRAQRGNRLLLEPGCLRNSAPVGRTESDWRHIRLRRAGVFDENMAMEIQLGTNKKWGDKTLEAPAYVKRASGQPR
jgi:hypothetical protein